MADKMIDEMHDVKAPSWLRRAGRGILQLILYLIAYLPSQRLRCTLFKCSGMRIGSRSVLYMGAEVRSPWRVRIGSGVAIGSHAVLDGRGGIQICDRVNMSSDVMLWTAQHDYRKPNFETMIAPVVIEEYAWLGPRVIVLPGVTIARGCVIGAGAVVTRSTEPYGVYGGIPAKRLGERSSRLDYCPGEIYIPFI